MSTKNRRTLTVAGVFSLGPCSPYTERHLKFLFAGRKRVGARDIAEMRIPALDKIWALSVMLTFEEQLQIIGRERLENSRGVVRTRDMLWGYVAKGYKGYRRRDGELIYEYKRDEAKRTIAAAVKILEGGR